MLDGLRVLEAGGGHTLGYAGRLLHLAGAEVVKEEPRGGDPVRRDRRSWTFLSDGKKVGPDRFARNEPGDRPPVRPLSTKRGTGVVCRSAALAGPGTPVPAGLPTVEVPAERQPVLDWAASGAMSLTGRADGPPRSSPGWQTAYLSGTAAAASLVARLLPWWSGRDPLPPTEAPASLGWRAAAQHLTRGGRTTCGGTGKLFVVDGVDVAAGLPRPDDMSLLEAWSRDAVDAGNPWCSVERGLARMGAEEGVERAQLLGMPFAVARQPEAATPLPFSWSATSTGRLRPSAPLVVDLTSLWAGPLCTALLARAGARVVRVESPARPDPTRWTATRLWDLLDHEKEHVTADLTTIEGRRALRLLLETADVVVESLRPRVLDELDLGPDTMLGERGDLVWVSITGYGRRGPWRDRVALGDDAAAAGGIVALTDEPGRAVFCADAYADPVTGVHAAFGALAALASGGGGVLDVAMADVVAHMVADADRPSQTAVRSADGWMAVSDDDEEPVAPPRLPHPDEWWRRAG